LVPLTHPPKTFTWNCSPLLLPMTQITIKVPLSDFEHLFFFFCECPFFPVRRPPDFHSSRGIYRYLASTFLDKYISLSKAFLSPLSPSLRRPPFSFPGSSFPAIRSPPPYSTFPIFFLMSPPRFLHHDLRFTFFDPSFFSPLLLKLSAFLNWAPAVSTWRVFSQCHEPDNFPPSLIQVFPSIFFPPFVVV